MAYDAFQRCDCADRFAGESLDDELADAFDDADLELEGDSMDAFGAELDLLVDEAVTGPAFRLACPGGCRVDGVNRTEAQCRATLRRDLATAVRFANRAAQLLEASPRTAHTIRTYRRVFGHAPERRIAWAPSYRDSGALTARRFRMVAAALNRRVVRFECGNQAEAPTANARTLSVTAIRLYPNQWAQSAAHRAATLVHEGMHMVFLNFLLHSRDASGHTIERRRINAHCYETLVLLLNGQTPSTWDVGECHHSSP